MEGFKGQEYRDEIAKTLKEFPKDERRELWEMEKDTPEYIAARQAKIEEQQKSLETDEIPEEEFSADDEDESIEEEPKKEKEAPLPPTKDTRAREIARRNPEELAQFLEGNGFSPTRKTELLQHYTQELEESIRLIAWTKRRLAYATAILERTLDTSDKSVTSAENMIQNYLIFSRVFEEGEKKFPRFGQFAYVMRSIFGGIASKEEIYERIAEHKTFGEQMKVDREEVSELVEEVSQMGAQIQEKFLAAQEKKRQYEEGLEEANVEEDNEKGLVWTVGHSAPKEYKFPNYTFQTGPLKGQNQAVGRSSWEPMLLAYADVVNKRMEDRIMAKTDLPEEERLERIKDNRVELLYEEFSFPVDIKEGENGKQKPVVYILDFIDINRWRALEVKGPLTPKAADKIRLFKKYYVDGDFSDLPEEKKIVMMSAVQEKKDEIADWCHENGYPVYDHFSSLEVLGAFKWDHDLNNFNRYKEVKQMEGLSQREKSLMQKGFYKLVEDKISSGRIPDIQPEGYMQAGKIHDLVQVNESVAGANKVPYEVEQTYSTKPYIPDMVVEKIVEETDETVIFDVLSNDTVYINLLDTVPLEPAKRSQLKGLLAANQIFETLDLKLRYSLNNLSTDISDELNNGKTQFSARVVTPQEWSFAYNAMENLRKKLSQTGELEGFAADYGVTSDEMITYLKGVSAFYLRLKPDKNSRIIVDKELIKADSDLQNLARTENTELGLSDIIYQVRNTYERPFGELLQKRKDEVQEKLIQNTRARKLILSGLDSQLELLENDRSRDSAKGRRHQLLLVSLKIGIKSGLSPKTSYLLPSILDENRDSGAVFYASSILYAIRSRFDSVSEAVDYFFDNAKDGYFDGSSEQREKLENFLLDSERHIKESFERNGDDSWYIKQSPEVSVLMTAMTKVLLRAEMGEEKYNKMVEELLYEYDSHVKSLNTEEA